MAKEATLHDMSVDIGFSRNIAKFSDNWQEGSVFKIIYV